MDSNTSPSTWDMRSLAPSIQPRMVQIGKEPDLNPAPKQLTEAGLTMGDLIDIGQIFERHKTDTTVHSSTLSFKADGTVDVNGRNDLRITDHSLGQLCSRFGIPFFGKSLPSPYIRQLLQQLPILAAPILQAHAEGYDKEVLIRLYQNKIRAILSKRYACIDNLTLLEQLWAFLDKPNERYKIVRPYISPDGMHIRIQIGTIYPQGADGPYSCGIVVCNNEIGLGKIEVLPFIQRHRCTNSTIWSEGGVRLKHIGNIHSKTIQVIATMQEVLPKSSEMIERMLEAQFEQLPSLSNIVSGLAQEHNWGEAISFAVMAGTEQQETRHGLVNGLTWAAHQCPELTPNQAITLETLGGQLLFMPKYQLERYATS